MLPPLTGCEPREVCRWPAIACGHLEFAVQARSRSRWSCEAVVRGRSGTAIAHPASMALADAAAAHFKLFQFADAAGRNAIAPLPAAFCSAVWLGPLKCELLKRRQ